MPAAALFNDRRLRLTYWHADKRVVDGMRLQLDRYVARLSADTVVQEVAELDDERGFPCDLLLINAAGAMTAAGDLFPQWLRGVRRRIVNAKASGHAGIWSPALIIADVDFSTLADLWPEASQDNWYFDILAPTHLSSLPIRVANLLRIHDHLHEIKRYATAVDEVSAKVAALESQLQSLRPSGSTK